MPLLDLPFPLLIVSENNLQLIYKLREAKLSSQKNIVSFFIYLKLASKRVNPTLPVLVLSSKVSLRIYVPLNISFTLNPDLSHQCSNPSLFSPTHLKLLSPLLYLLLHPHTSLFPLLKLMTIMSKAALCHRQSLSPYPLLSLQNLLIFFPRTVNNHSM